MRSTEVRRGNPPRVAGVPGEAVDGDLTSRFAVWPQVLRRHWLAAALLAAGLVLRVLAQFAYRPALFYIDSVKYLYTAQGNDPEGYKLPLRAILLVANLNTVVVIQHLLGLCIGVAIYVLLLRRGVSRWLAALAMAPVLLDAYQLQNEQTIMPGTWFEALIVAGIAILLWRPAVTWRRVVAAGIVLGTSATVAQVGEALIPAAAIFVLAAGWTSWRQGVGKAVALCAACALPILAYSAGSYLLGGGFFLSHQGVTSVYGRTAAAVDCATIKLPADERGLCPTPAEQARGNDWLEFGTYAPVQRYYRNQRSEVDSLVTSFSHAVLTQQPTRVLGAYGRDVLKLFAVTRDTAPGDPPISRWQFQTSFPYYLSHATPAIVRTAVDRFGGGKPAVWRPGAAFLRSYQLDGGYTPGPLLAAVRACRADWLGVRAASSRRSGPPPARARQPAVLRRGSIGHAGIRPVRVLLALPAASASHARAGRRARYQRRHPLVRDPPQRRHLAHPHRSNACAVRAAGAALCHAHLRRPPPARR